MIVRYEIACAMIGLGEYNSALNILLDLQKQDALNVVFPPLSLEKKILSAYLEQKRYEDALLYVKNDSFMLRKLLDKKDQNYLDIVTTVAKILIMQKRYTDAFTVLHYVEELRDEILLRRSDSDSQGSSYSDPPDEYEFRSLEVKYTRALACFFMSQDRKKMTINEEMLPHKEHLPQELSARMLFKQMQDILKNQESSDYLQPGAYSIEENVGEVLQRTLRDKALKSFERVLQMQENDGFLENDPRVLSVKFYIARLHYYLGEREEALQELQNLQKVQEKVIGLNHPSTLATVSAIQELFTEGKEKLAYLKDEIEKRKSLLQSKRSDLNVEGVSTLETIYAEANSDGCSSVNESIPSSSKELPPGNKRTLDTENTQAKRRKIDNQQPLSSCLGQGDRKKRSDTDCLFSWDDIDEFNNAKDLDNRDVDKIKIDSGRFLTYIKNSQDKGKSDQLVEFVGTVSNIEGNHKYLLNEVVQDGGYVNYAQNKRIKDLQNDVLQQDGGLAKNSKLKSRLINAAGRIQLIRGMHGAVVSCKDGTATDCGLNIGGIAWSFASQPIENVMVRVTPKLVKLGGNVAEKVIPGTLGKQTRFAIRILGAKSGTTIARGTAGALAGVFDIVDIGIRVKLRKSVSKVDRVKENNKV